MTSAVKVVVRGPQGIAGERASLLSMTSDVTQAIPQHDGSVATEVVVNFGSKVGEAVEVAEGVVTLLKDLNSLSATVEAHFVKMGGSPVLAFWVESSTGGEVWIPIPESLRSRTVEKDGTGTMVLSLKTDLAMPKGTMLRVVCTNTNSGAISLEAEESLQLSSGTVTGFAKKIAIIGR